MFKGNGAYLLFKGYPCQLAIKAKFNVPFYLRECFGESLLFRFTSESVLEKVYCSVLPQRVFWRKFNIPFYLRECFGESLMFRFTSESVLEKV